VKIKNLARPVGATAIAFGIAAGTVIPAWAIDNIQQFGKQEVLNNGASGTAYTVAGLSPSTDSIPYPVSGTLYESTVTVNALWGSVTPVIPMFNARAESGQNYRVLANVLTPDTLSGAALAAGDSSTGKIYFDVVGDVPNSVVYNDGTHDLLGWVP
jgi:Domain of unknown function (DUF1942)